MTRKSNCIYCGRSISVEATSMFIGAVVVGGTCTSCAEYQASEDGGVVFTQRQEDISGRFPVGKITITPGAIAALADAVEHVGTYLTRHVLGDWGSFGDFEKTELTEDEKRRGWEATEGDAKINKSNLLNRRDRIMSGYHTGRGTKLWIITRLNSGGGTTVLLPEEY